MKYQKQIVDGQEVNFSSDWINNLESEIHFSWYYHQAKLVYSNCLPQDRIMEIGIGTGLLSDLLKKRGWDVRTLDIDEGKNPDFCESAFKFDYARHKIDTILAFEIFEHIPFDTFLKTIRKISRAGVSRMYFSLPWNEIQLVDFSLKLPKLPRANWSLTVAKGRVTTDTHFWELARRDKQASGGQLISMSTLEEHFRRNCFRIQPLKKIGYIHYFSATRF